MQASVSSSLSPPSGPGSKIPPSTCNFLKEEPQLLHVTERLEKALISRCESEIVIAASSQNLQLPWEGGILWWLHATKCTKKVWYPSDLKMSPMMSSFFVCPRPRLSNPANEAPPETWLMYSDRMRGALLYQLQQNVPWVESHMLEQLYLPGILCFKLDPTWTLCSWSSPQRHSWALWRGAHRFFGNKKARASASRSRPAYIWSWSVCFLSPHPNCVGFQGRPSNCLWTIFMNCNRLARDLAQRVFILSLIQLFQRTSLFSPEICVLNPAGLRLSCNLVHDLSGEGPWPFWYEMSSNKSFQVERIAQDQLNPLTLGKPCPRCYNQEKNSGPFSPSFKAFMSSD